MSEEHARKSRRATLGLVVCWALVATIGVIALVFQGRDNREALRHANVAIVHSIVAIQHSEQTLRALQKSELNTCHRLNIARAASNANQLADWRFEEQFIALLRAGLRHQTSSVKRNRSQVQATRVFIRSLQAESLAKSWLPLTNCRQAVFEGAPPPQPVSFGTRLPPRSALVLGSGN